MNDSTRAQPGVLTAIALTSAVLLAYQISATRILSATTSYEVSFAIIALVMLGLAASGTRLYLDRKNNPGDRARTPRALVRGAASIVVGMVLVVGSSHIPLEPFYQIRIATIVALLAFYPPFYFTGYAIAAILTDFAEDVGRVYWADLVGAAIGCFAVVPVLSLITPIQIGLVSAVTLSVAALLVSRTRDDETARRTAVVALGTTIAIAVVGIAVPAATDIRRAKFADREAMWSSWNHLSRVTVYDAYGPTNRPMSDANLKKFSSRAAIGWGVSDEYKDPLPDLRRVLLDNGAATTMIKDGADADLSVLQWDVTSLGHHAKRGELDHVFIIGGGGGRDILTALSFGAKSVDVVELNPDVVRLVQDVMGDFSNRPYTAPGVHHAIGDARSELSRRDTKYDLIQMSMIDTFASSTSGALALTENVLYTQEAFDIYREHLSDNGVLSVTRWYNRENYGDLARLISLVGDSLQRGGVAEPDDHVVIAYTEWMASGLVSTVLMKKTPFTPDELQRIEEARQQQKFTQIWPVADGAKPELDVHNFLRGKAPPEAEMWLELDPPSDDFPFFFNLYRPVMSYVGALRDGSWNRVSRATNILLGLLLIAIVWSWMLVMRPLRAEGEVMEAFGRGPRVFFACLGLGFLCVELAMIQRLTIYLGHPSYSLTVVLASLLFFGGIGSFLSQRITTVRGTQRAALLVVGVIVVSAIVVPLLLSGTEPWALGARQALAVVCLLPVGVSLGLMYPSGIRQLVASGGQSAVPWAWAVNGVWGVIASVLGMLVAMTLGYRALLLVAAATYLLAAWALGKFEVDKSAAQ